ncbi:o-succinylbenzoate--CoA ligase [Aeribacillus alveayuensis]|uniref:2-succinylbenzoate--CoA ligase n=1 Tax=Aeribacillus alveayuensis TaxID=279215 RepID=A0ABT9VIY7_9BACI|nr:O-succinylbenzoic acid--CoA ligase [Bacillus alveayuensis]
MINPTMMPNWLKQRAFLTPDRIAITYGNEQITFSKLDEMVMRRARQLAAIGVRQNDYVGLLMRNSLEMVLNIHALLYLGAIIVFFNTRLTEKELIWQIHDSKVKWTICDDELQGFIKGQTKTINTTELCSMKESETEIVTTFSLQHVATVMYTSGTTGKPKGVQQTYGNHWWSAVGSMLNLGLRENDSWLLAVPLFHISGLSILFRSVIYGIRVILHRSFNANRMNEAIKKQNATIASVVSTMLQQMIEELGEERYPCTFRCMLLGGGPAPKPLLEACQAKEIPVFQTYGMTETASQVVTLAPEYCFSKLGSAGKPLFPVEIKIVQNEKTCRPYEEGEIVIKGPNVTIGYLNRSDSTSKSIRNGWFYTGDIGYLDGDGFLYVLDRRSDLIVSGGENIYPAEVEAVLLSHPNILDAGVIGKKDEKWGQVPFAFIVCSQNISERELVAFCEERLAKYKVPKGFKMVKELPRNASKKLLRRKLKEKLDEK